MKAGSLFVAALTILLFWPAASAQQAIAQNALPNPQSPFVGAWDGYWRFQGSMGDILLTVSVNTSGEASCTIQATNVPAFGANPVRCDYAALGKTFAFRAVGSNGDPAEARALELKGSTLRGWVYHAGQTVWFELRRMDREAN